MSTDPHHFDPDDPRLTAYALGELTDPGDRARMEQLLAASPEARAELADIRSLTAALTAEYEQERATAVAPPVNVVAVPHSRWRTPAPWLQVAALLCIVGLAVRLALPFYRSESPRSRSAVGGMAKFLEASEPDTRAAAPMHAPPPARAKTAAGPAPLLATQATPASASNSLLASARPAPRGLIQPKGTPLVFVLAPTEKEEQRRSMPPLRVQSGNTYSSDKKVAAADSSASTDELRATADSSQSRPVVQALQRRAALASASGGAAFQDAPGKERASKAQDAPAAFNTADYGHTVENKFLAAKENPLSTFSIDVDTASYSIVRRFIDAGSLPPPDAVRVEEMLNYFPFDDAPPAPDSQEPFAIHVEAAACPWDTGHRLVRIGIKAREIERDQRPPSNLVFLLDVSGSMMPEERLPLIKQCLHLLVEKLREDDHVAIVVYAGESGLALPSTTGDHKDAILRAIDGLHAGGSTNGAAGIRLAYQVARQNFIQGGTNRVILSTDGDFNVGVTSRGDLLRLVEEERKDGVFLTVLGVGTDNLKDGTMQVLADHGNGNYAYVDRLAEGRKVLVNQMSGTLVPVAKDVRIQVEFNPAAVASYRLIGYEKRLLHKEDFNDDRVDAGEIGAGRSVTALYEVVPVDQGARGAGPAVDALKYQAAPAANAARRAPEAVSREMLTVKMRQKAPAGDQSERTEEKALVDHGAPGEYANASPDFQFAAAVASFGMVLRDSPYKGDATLASALELAQAGKGEDPDGYRAGFIDLLRQTQALPPGER